MEGVGCNTLRKAHDYYGKLRAFAVMLVTDNEQVFCDCYAYCVGYSKPKREVGHHIWNLMNHSAELQRQYYARRKARHEK